MASIIKVETLQDTSGNNAIGMQYVANGVAKVWLKYNQATPGVDNSLNVSSVADTATARYTISFTNNWGNINYTSVTGGSFDGNDTSGGSSLGHRHKTPTTSSLELSSNYGQTGTAADWASNETNHNGDLA